MIGIYCYTNIITKEKYIGQSVDIAQRQIQHRYYSKQKDTPFYRAIRKYGWDNFHFEILEECDVKDLDGKEQFYIKKYNSYLKGYNCTRGGQYESSSIGEENGRTSFTNDEVLTIRKQIYLEHKDISELYVNYKDRISKDRFWSMIHGETWKNVDTSMIYSLKERGYKNFSGSKNPQAKINEEDVKNIRKRIETNGEERKIVYQDYQNRMSYSAFCKVVRYETWKDIKY